MANQNKPNKLYRVVIKDRVWNLSGGAFEKEILPLLSPSTIFQLTIFSQNNLPQVHHHNLETYLMSKLCGEIPE